MPREFIHTVFHFVLDMPVKFPITTSKKLFEDKRLQTCREILMRGDFCNPTPSCFREKPQKRSYMTWNCRAHVNRLENWRASKMLNKNPKTPIWMLASNIHPRNFENSSFTPFGSTSQEVLSFLRQPCNLWACSPLSFSTESSDPCVEESQKATKSQGLG